MIIIFFFFYTEPYNNHRQFYTNLYANQDSWVKMTLPVDSRAQTPINVSTKPTNTDKMVKIFINKTI